VVGERGPSTWRIFPRGYTCDLGSGLRGTPPLPGGLLQAPASVPFVRGHGLCPACALLSARCAVPPSPLVSFSSPGPRTISSTFPVHFVVCGEQWQAARRSCSFLICFIFLSSGTSIHIDEMKCDFCNIGLLLNIRNRELHIQSCNGDLLKGMNRCNCSGCWLNRMEIIQKLRYTPAMLAIIF